MAHERTTGFFLDSRYDKCYPQEWMLRVARKFRISREIGSGRKKRTGLCQTVGGPRVPAPVVIRMEQPCHPSPPLETVNQASGIKKG